MNVLFIKLYIGFITHANSFRELKCVHGIIIIKTYFV